MRHDEPPRDILISTPEEEEAFRERQELLEAGLASQIERDTAHSEENSQIYRHE